MRWNLLRTLAVLALALTLAAGAAQADNPSFLAGSQVVLLTGLPGDVESETSYRSETARLLEILALVEPPPRRIVVLSDAGTVDEILAGLEVVSRTASRRNFLDLAGELDAETPLTVFAWGHGGEIRGAPVLHVRGPRLEPADFAHLAEASGEPARFVLLFRHSGDFARALAAPGREILASEHGTAFRSDPIAMGPLLEILRAEPGLDLTSLAERVGPAVRRWYEEQSLARQEEPTLWTEDRAPVALAGLESPEAGETASTLSGIAWEDVEPVDPARYPDADAVVLRRVEKTTLGDRPAVQTEVDLFLQILTPEGTVHADFDLAYAPPEERLSFLDLEVRSPGGAVHRLTPDDVRDATPRALPGYRPATRKIFSLPGAVPGAILRVHYRRTWQSFPLPHTILEIPLVESLPAVETEIELRVGRDAPFHYDFRHDDFRHGDFRHDDFRHDDFRHDDFRHHSGGAPETTTTPTTAAHVFRFRDLAPRPDEVLQAPRTPTLLVSTFPSWDEYLAWYRRLIERADELTPEIAAKAAELTADIAEPREKVAALYRFVTGLRYVAIPFGVNSHRPHAAANVFANRYGDCKDKANLLNTMLRSVGVDADLVLVPRFSQAHENVPGLGFNHAISRIRLGDEILWADTTDDVARFGLLPPGDPGRRVLVVADDAEGLVELPRPRAGDHRLELTARIEVPPAALDNPADAALPTRLAIATHGFPDYALRATARNLAGREATRPLPLRELAASTGLFALETQRFTAPGALGEPFAWTGTGSFSAVLTSVGAGVLLRAPFLLPAEWDAALHERSTPLYLNRGYPLTIEQEITFALPPGVEMSLPAEHVHDSEPLRFSLRFSRGDAGTLVARLELTLTAGDLDEAATATFQTALRRLTAALSEGATHGL